MKSHARMKLFLKALKIAVGSVLAIVIAELLGLSYATSAGIITLLTIQDTWKDTVQLTSDRLMSYLMCIILIFACFHIGRAGWVGFTFYILLMVVICYLAGWPGTISVNAVMGTHYLMTPDYSISFAFNELALILIGTGIALFMNWKMPNYRKSVQEDVQAMENLMEQVLREMALWLDKKPEGEQVWMDLDRLEERLEESLERAWEQAHNTLDEDDLYCAEYMQMCCSQCAMLQTLRESVKKVRSRPKQVVYVSRYLEDLAAFMHNRNAPEEAMWKLQNIFDQMEKEALPRTREEFENRAILFHVLMDLEEFLLVKQRFLENTERETGV